MLATGFPKTNKRPSSPPQALIASLLWGTLDASPEALWKAPGWLRASHRSAFPNRDPL